MFSSAISLSSLFTKTQVPTAKMRASQLVSLSVGLVLITVQVQQVTSLPILEANWKQSEVDSLQVYKRGKSSKIHAQETDPTPRQHQPASHVMNANSHLSSAAAHIAVGASKYVTLPAAGVYNAGRSLIKTPMNLANLDASDLVINGIEGGFLKPVHTIFETIAQPPMHVGSATAHVGYALKNYAQAATSWNKDSKHTKKQVKQRQLNTLKKIYRDPVKHATMSPDERNDAMGRFGFP
jgi:hypothetical protein